MPLPHIRNSYAGVNNLDPVHKSLFEVYFTLPAALRGEFQKDEMLLTEHVLTVGGLGTLDPEIGVDQQKFMGTDRSFLKPKLDSTHHEIEVKFTMNLRDGTDNYIYKLFKAWHKLGYNIATGEIVLKKDYVADWLKVSIANRVGDVYREIVFKNVMMTITDSGQGDLDYSDSSALELTVKFYSDWADEENV